MENRTLRDMFPDVKLKNQDAVAPEEDNKPEATKAAGKAAADLLNLLGDDAAQDRRVVVKINEKSFLQLNAICKKKGLTPTAVIRPFILDFIRENEGLLE